METCNIYISYNVLLFHPNLFCKTISSKHNQVVVLHLLKSEISILVKISLFLLDLNNYDIYHRCIKELIYGRDVVKNKLFSVPDINTLPLAPKLTKIVSLRKKIRKMNILFVLNFNRKISFFKIVIEIL